MKRDHTSTKVTQFLRCYLIIWFNEGGNRTNYLAFPNFLFKNLAVHFPLLFLTLSHLSNNEWYTHNPCWFFFAKKKLSETYVSDILWFFNGVIWKELMPNCYFPPVFCCQNIDEHLFPYQSWTEEWKVSCVSCIFFSQTQKKCASRKNLRLVSGHGKRTREDVRTPSNTQPSHLHLNIIDRPPSEHCNEVQYSLWKSDPRFSS